MAASCSVKMRDQRSVASLVWICVTLLKNMNSLGMMIRVMVLCKVTYMAEMGSM